MMLKNILAVLIALATISCTSNNDVQVVSPDKKVQVSFFLNESGVPQYQVRFNNEEVIKTSKMGFAFENIPNFEGNFELVNSEVTSFNETWQMPWGEQIDVVNNYNQLLVHLKEKSDLGRTLHISFRVYNDGIGFRYEIPEQEHISEVLISEENTEFNLTGDHQTWWIPGDWDIYEHLYTASKFSEIDALSKAGHPNLVQTYIPVNAVNTPVTMRAANGVHLSFHEAALVDYSGMTLAVDTENMSMKSNLVGSENTTYKVRKTAPFHTPWRTLQISSKATELIDSKLIVNLNEPNKLEDISWFKPMKYTGIWWEMHLAKTDWHRDNGRHGATTENTKSYIDFSAKNNIGGVLVEGWNTGWGSEGGGFDFVSPYPDYNLQELVAYGKKKGVEIIMHHETFGGVSTYTKQQDTAYALMQSLGIHSVKTGYVGKIVPNGEYHHGQYMVNHYNNTVEKAAEYQVAINAHEPIKATGLRRTYPNTISREGLRGQEFNAWASDGGNPPSHLPTVAFTRMLSGPIDFTPGIFNIKFDEWKKDNQVNTTIAQQLALYVVIYSPIQMAADLIEHYEGNPALQFIKDVEVDWEQTEVLSGEVGEFVTIARKGKGTGNWFVGAITNENARNIEIDFSFLDENQEYDVIVYQDGESAHWDANPTSLTIEQRAINSTSKETFYLAEGGGIAISIIKK